MKRSPKWKLAANVSKFASAEFQLTVDVAQAGTGCKLSRASDELGSVFGAENKLLESQAAADSYETFCRGADLVTRYTGDAAQPSRMEIYWRPSLDGFNESDVEADDDGVEAPSLLAVEAICSLETDLLDSVPSPIFQSTLRTRSDRWFQQNADETWEAVPSDQLAELKPMDGQLAVACLTLLESGAVVLQTVLPADLLAVNCATEDGATTSQWTLASDFLEKGVIRRMRMFAVLATNLADEQRLFQAANRFYQSELPLTV